MKASKKKIFISLLIGGLLLGLTTQTMTKANEMEEEEKTVDTTPLGLTDSAFPESSKPLHDAILKNYPGIDSNKDGSITIGEANAYTGTIVLSKKELTGTITGIENFTNITRLSINNNQFTGVIPESIGEMKRLTLLRLEGNQLTGSIPKSIGNISSLTVIYLNNNQLEGNIPSELGNLSNLQQLLLNENKLEGTIPSSLGNHSLQIIYVGNNYLSGEIPAEIAKNTALRELMICNNKGLTGDLETMFALHPSLTFLVINGTSTTKNRPESDILTVFITDLFDEDGNIYDYLTQDDINEQLESLENLKDIKNVESGSGSYWDLLVKEGEIKIENSQKQFDLREDAKKKVYELFKTDNSGKIVDNLDQKLIDNANTAVNLLAESDLKDTLQSKIKDAQEQLNEKNAEKAVNDLFDKDTKIKDTVTQEDINNAQELVNKVTDIDKKKEFQDKLDEAQRQLNKKNAEKAVDDLFNEDAKIKDTVTQEDINNAQELVNKVKDEDKKA
ncbi:toxin Cry1Ac domain D-VI-related protein [Breznakia pachnodae]|uniref:Leucine-rich repeat (LRR) protein n=1 Tax=Breznakia pachnodae TaxID=265178 RepID=A0ABU0E1H1_9FIRM|nr:toxin Cry1Ac domain D-VI-related protein [Breznakia pachnodae]MDQ0360645.1 Leucine-rich repeat (LRR) protein [Breznakia pachnodae]